MAPLQRFVLFIYLALSCNVLSVRHFRLNHTGSRPLGMDFFSARIIYILLLRLQRNMRLENSRNSIQMAQGK